jgi:hypothetical protein
MLAIVDAPRRRVGPRPRPFAGHDLQDAAGVREHRQPVIPEDEHRVVGQLRVEAVLVGGCVGQPAQVAEARQAVAPGPPCADGRGVLAGCTGGRWKRQAASRQAQHGCGLDDVASRKAHRSLEGEGGVIGRRPSASPRHIPDRGSNLMGCCSAICASAQLARLMCYFPTHLNSCVSDTHLRFFAERPPPPFAAAQKTVEPAKFS